MFARSSLAALWWLALHPLGASAQETLIPTAAFPGERLGQATAAASDLALLGAPQDAALARPGRVVVFRSRSGVWFEEAELGSSDPRAFDGFGTGLATDGARVAVGATHAAAPAPRPGVVYVFVRRGSEWIEEARLTPSDSSAGDGFGQALALSGDRLLVGAPLRDEGPDPDAGAAYLFRREAAGWVEEARLRSSDLDAFDGFGRALALESERCVIAAPGDDDQGGLSGSAYVFDGSGGAWIETQKLLASDGAAIDRFGTSVGLSRGRVAVGSPRSADRGAVYVFEPDMGALTEVAKLSATDADFADLFGVTLAIEGPVLTVGAPNEDEAAPAAGALYVFHRFTTGWDEVAKLTASDAQAADTLGFGSALSGDQLVAGAPAADPGGTDSGAGYVFSVPLPEIGTPYCFGLPGACPCGNPGGLFRGCANSTGAGASLVALASAGVAADDLRLAAGSLPRGRAALLFAGLSAVGGGAGAPLGDGLRCAGGGVVRLGAAIADAAGGARFGPGLAAAGGWTPGSERRFQVWYRDPLGGACGTGSNLTNGVLVHFEP